MAFQTQLAFLDSSNNPWFLTIDNTGTLLTLSAAPVGTKAQVRTLAPNIPRLGEIVQDAYYLFQVQLPPYCFRLDVDSSNPSQPLLQTDAIPFSNCYPSAFFMTSPNGTDYMLTVTPDGTMLPVPRNWSTSPASNSAGQAVGQLDTRGTSYNLSPPPSYYPNQPNGQGNPVTMPDQRASDKSGGVFAVACSHIVPCYTLEYIPSQYPPSLPPNLQGVLGGAPSIASGLALLVKCPLCGYVQQIFDPAWAAQWIYISPRVLPSDSERDLAL